MTIGRFIPLFGLLITGYAALALVNGDPQPLADRLVAVTLVAAFGTVLGTALVAYLRLQEG